MSEETAPAPEPGVSPAAELTPSPLEGGSGSRDRFESAKQLDASLNNVALVLTGPVIGKVTATTAVVLLEVDESCPLTIVMKSEDGHEVRTTKDFRKYRPRAFVVEGLNPDTVYMYTFEGLSPCQFFEVEALGATIKTFPTKIDKVRVIALSCDQPRRMLKGDENPWDRLNTVCSKNQCDVMLHLGDQVYTKMDGFLERAMMKMDQFDSKSATESSKRKMRHAAGHELRGAYRYVWNLPSTRATLAKSSHLMIWSDNDVANDFTEKKVSSIYF
jgi:phosphodiesterase/alkaline phosphatase D-like protein